MKQPYEEYIITCSPVYIADGTETYIVHLKRLRKGRKIFDRIAVKVPEYDVIGLYGFSNSDVAALVSYIRDNEDVIYDIAIDNPNYTVYHSM